MTDILQKYGITFDEARHAYRDVKGFPLPSVTQILPFKCDGPEDVIRKAAERGHRVHKMIERMELGGPPVDVPDVIESDAPYVDAWLKFKEITGFELARFGKCEFPECSTDTLVDSVMPMVERFVYHPLWQFVGRLDIVGYPRRIRGIENDLTLVDAKTGMASPVTSLQTAAYMAAMNLELKQLGLPLIKHRWAAKLQADGSCKRESYTDHKSDLATFLNRLGWVRWAWKYGYETPKQDDFIVPELNNELELSITI